MNHEEDRAVKKFRMGKPLRHSAWTRFMHSVHDV